MVWYGMVNVDLYSASSQKSLMRCAH